MANAHHRIFGSTPMPRYLQLAGLIRQRVAKGYWPPGSLLPSIEHLMVEFDVARVTVRQAIANSWPRRLDDSAARDEWGWRAEYDLETMTADMLEHLRAGTAKTPAD